MAGSASLCFSPLLFLAIGWPIEKARWGIGGEGDGEIENGELENVAGVESHPAGTPGPEGRAAAESRPAGNGICEGCALVRGGGGGAAIERARGGPFGRSRCWHSKVTRREEIHPDRQGPGCEIVVPLAPFVWRRFRFCFLC